MFVYRSKEPFNSTVKLCTEWKYVSVDTLPVALFCVNGINHKKLNQIAVVFRLSGWFRSLRATLNSNASGLHPPTSTTLHKNNLISTKLTLECMRFENYTNILSIELKGGPNVDKTETIEQVLHEAKNQDYLDWPAKNQSTFTRPRRLSRN
jgi:hypothetical protein